MSASSSHSPLHKPEQGDAWAPPLDMALGLAREALVEQADANVYDKQAMIAAAVQLEIRLRGLVAALDKDKELAAAVAAHGAFPMPAGDTARRPRRFTPLEEAVQGIETAIAPLKGDARAGADMVLTYLRTLTTPDTTVPRDLRPGADAARRMIRDRQTAEDPHDSPLHRTYETGHDLPEVGSYRSVPLPTAAALCATCGHNGAAHHHAGTACWADIPKRLGEAIRLCKCSAFVEVTS
ncbi:hypothetical protein ACFWYQ_21210 [[Kitasatospora] papulosa]|uniref:hypothetical protein n=1 Tax=[Kitasatospora] papulosa TaxID=1464011 RepID=UPI0036D1F0BB